MVRLSVVLAMKSVLMVKHSILFRVMAVKLKLPRVETEPYGG